MTDSTHHWLPERHLGVAATLSHADELIGQVGDLLFAYQTQAQGVLGLREVPLGAFSRTVVGSVAPIPRKVPLLVADALVALRAALEHTLFAEVEFLDGASLDEKAARVVEMPASDTYEKFEEWTKKQLRIRPPSLRASSELVRRIDRLQPFHRQSDPQMHPLARLVLHTNHAKHRTPAITAVRLATMYQDDQMPRSVRDLPPRPEEPLRVGDVIAETPIGTIIPVTLFPTVGINRPGTDRWPVLMQELDEISRWVRTQAVPRLVTGTEPPELALPTRYEIAVGHQDERRAMSMGSTTSAADRHSRRLSAAVVRTDLVDLIGRVDGSPSDQQIAGWLAQLTDEEVLDRMSRLKVTHTYDPGVMLHNFEVLEGLRDEALGYVRC
ncbi:hypothetical protein [Micromonospora sp. NPDC023888]|uniref:hypothetical protein n=1 Tax=Micromonospora sp. NPDC023888 TaxID=3155607 RepID=UPI003411C2CA